MILYVKTGCPYCKKVLDFASANHITFSEIKEKNEPGVLDELIERGGKSQFPYLVDTSKGVEMYESADIISHLQTHYVHGESKESDSTGVCNISLE